MSCITKQTKSVYHRKRVWEGRERLARGEEEEIQGIKLDPDPLR